MKVVNINVDIELALQIAGIMNAVDEAAKAGERIRLKGARASQTLAYDRARKIDDATIKALMDSLGIDEYVEEDENGVESAVKYTYDELNKKESDFGSRNKGKFAAAMTIPALIGGGIGAGAVFGASAGFGANLLGAGFLASFVVGGPVGPLVYVAAVAIGAAAFLAVSAFIAGITYLIKKAKENTVIKQHQDDIAQAIGNVTTVVNAANAEKAAAVKKAAAEKAVADKVAEVTEYISNRFDKLYVDLANDTSLYLHNDVDPRPALQQQVNDAREKLLKKIPNWIAGNKSGADMVGIIDAAYTHQFCVRLAHVIKTALYNHKDSLDFQKGLYNEDDKEVEKAFDVIAAKYEQKAQDQANGLAVDLEKGLIINLFDREAAEKTIAQEFKKKMDAELDAMLKPEALEAARAAAEKDRVATLAEAMQNVAEAEKTMEQLSVMAGATHTPFNMFAPTSAANDKAVPVIVVGNGLK